MSPLNFLKDALLRTVMSILRRSKNQTVWEEIFQLSLRKMNYGNGSEFNESGELNMLQRVEQALRPYGSLVVFDVGANVGKYAIELVKHFGSNAKIYSFEPSAKTFEMFCNNTKGIASIVPNNLGFSNESSSQVLFSNSEGSGLASVYQRKLDHFGISMNQQETIRLSTIDLFAREQGISRIHFLKLDIEGHELKALQGAKALLDSNAIDFIQFEFGGCNIDSRTYFQDFYYLLKDRYRLFRILEDGLLELPVYKETYEVFITINYLAVRRDINF